MATNLDLQEQEQLDAFKAFWKQYGNLITWVLILLLGAYAGWNGWNWWQRDQAQKAAAMFDALDQAVVASDAERAQRVLGDLQQRFPRTAFAAQGALAVAKLQADKGQTDAAKAALQWVADRATEPEYQTVAKLRLAGVLLEAKQFDEALKLLDGAKAEGFEALVADRRGDVLSAAGKPAEALAAYQAAYAAMDDQLDYRRLVEAKLTALGAPPAAPAAAAASGAAK